MPRITVNQLAVALDQLRAQMAEISQRMQALETPSAREGAVSPAAASAASQPAEAPTAPVETGPVAITEEELIAISAAIGAYLGVHAHIRQIRLVSSNAWAQQGRVSIQASHMLQI
jgi:methylmalonyl-CoA carboxyltransferase large subunit